MTQATAIAPDTMLSRTLALGKDFFSLLRDGALFGLAVLLIAFPNQLNAVLVSAGFEEGSVVGFKWKSKLVQSNDALQQAQATIASLQTKNRELLDALAEANSKAQDPELLKRATALEEENRRENNRTDEVQAIVANTLDANEPLVQKARASTEPTAPAPAPPAKSAYTVGLQTLGVGNDDRVALNEQLRADGFGLDPITYSYPAGQRPAWFATRSTVFYYGASARPMAQQLADFMKAKTGQTFAVQRGAGLGVDAARKDLTLFVHYLRD